MRAILQFGGSNFVTSGHSYRELCDDVRLSLASLVPLPKGELCFLCRLSPERGGGDNVDDGILTVYSEESFLLFLETVQRRRVSSSHHVGAPTASLPIFQLDAKGSSNAYRMAHCHSPREHSPIPHQPEVQNAGAPVVPHSAWPASTPYREVSNRIHHPMEKGLVDALPLSKDIKQGLEIKSYAEYMKVLQEMEDHGTCAEAMMSHRSAPPPISIPSPVKSFTRQRVTRMDSHQGHATSLETTRGLLPTPTTVGSKNPVYVAGEPLLSDRENEILGDLLGKTEDMRYDTSCASRRSSATPALPWAPGLRPSSSPYHQAVAPTSNVKGRANGGNGLPQRRPASAAPPLNPEEMRSHSRSASQDYHHLFARQPVSSVYEKYLHET